MSDYEFTYNEIYFDDARSTTSSSSAVYPCTEPNCDKVFWRPSRLQTHMLSHTGERPFVCDYSWCQKSYARAAHLKRHKQNAHVQSPASSIVDGDGDDNSRRLPCSDCDLTFANKYSLDKHKRLDHSSAKNKTYSCNDCGQAFVKRKILAAHRADAHPGAVDRPHPCPDCDMRFKYPRQLKVHSKLHRGYECELCQKLFAKWSMLKTHLAKDHPKPDFVCAICSAKFKSRMNYRSHLATHNDNREVFRCPHKMCPRWYYFEKNLQDHLQGYHEGRRFPCPIEGCESRLGSRLARRKHLKTMHTDEERSKQKTATASTSTSANSSKIKKKRKTKAPKVGEDRRDRRDKGCFRKPVIDDLLGITFDQKKARGVMEKCGQVALSPESIGLELSENKVVANLDLDTSVITTDDEGVDQTKQNNNNFSDSNQLDLILKPLPELKRTLFQENDSSSDSDDEENADLKATKEVVQDVAPKKTFDFSKFMSG